MDNSLSQYFDLPDLSQNESALKDLVIGKITFLIQNDFEKLIYILYRVDVNEHKIKEALALKKNMNAAEIIYNLLHERENEKARSRELFRSQKKDDSNEW